MAAPILLAERSAILAMALFHYSSENHLRAKRRSNNKRPFIRDKEYMKITVIGDLHGLDVWKKIVKTERDSDQFVFIGDYLDSRTIEIQQQTKNLRKILEFKQANRERVALLLGNHDFQYMNVGGTRCSGYSPLTEVFLKSLFREALMRQDFGIYGTQRLYPHGELRPHCFTHFVLFSHAGISNTWERSVRHIRDHNSLTPEIYPFLNFRRGSSDTGDDVFQSPLWIRPNSLLQDAVNATSEPLTGYTQIVGHTTHDTITVKKSHNNDSDIWFIDTLSTSGEYLTIKGDEFIVKNV